MAFMLHTTFNLFFIVKKHAGLGYLKSGFPSLQQKLRYD